MSYVDEETREIQRQQAIDLAAIGMPRNEIRRKVGVSFDLIKQWLDGETQTFDTAAGRDRSCKIWSLASDQERRIYNTTRAAKAARRAREAAGWA